MPLNVPLLIGLQIIYMPKNFLQFLGFVGGALEYKNLFQL